jgi:hypothetical protein
MLQQGDVKLFQTDDDGEITVIDGIVEMSGGLETTVYLALFGGNEDDDGRDENVHNWWGNLDENEPAKQYRSETQNLIESIPATTFNLKRVEDAANRDLAFMTPDIATTVDVSVTIPALNRVKFTITINGDETVEFVENWKASL